MKLAIIGTAGRREDAAKLTSGYYRSMLTVAQVVTEVIGADTLVSGGAAWADAIAVDLYMADHARNLSLHLPTEFEGGRFAEKSFDKFDPGAVANYYHAKFSNVIGRDSLLQIRDAIRKGAKVSVNPGGFKARNTDVAEEADVLLAFTFSGGPLPRDGGTRDTWDKFTRKPGKKTAYHFDLDGKRLYRTEFS